MSTNPTIPIDQLSREIIQDGFRAELQSYADRPESPLKESDRPDRSGKQTPELVVTSFPDQPRYPHIVVQEADVSSEPIDQRQDELFQHDFSVLLQVEAKSSNQKFRIKALVRSVLQDRRPHLKERGFAELSWDSTSADWDQTSQTASWQCTVTGLVHTRPTDTDD